MFDVVLTFKYGIVHRIVIEDLEVAQNVLQSVRDAFESANRRNFNYLNVANELVFTCNLDNLMFSYIEKQKEKEE